MTTFVCGLVSLLLSFALVCCFWPIAVPLFIVGVVLMIVGGRPEPKQPQQYYQQNYYPQHPPQQALPPAQPQYPPYQQPGHQDEGWRSYGDGS